MASVSFSTAVYATGEQAPHLWSLLSPRLVSVQQSATPFPLLLSYPVDNEYQRAVYCTIKMVS
jgi:hypothetical protein